MTYECKPGEGCSKLPGCLEFARFGRLLLPAACCRGPASHGSVWGRAANPASETPPIAATPATPQANPAPETKASLAAPVTPASNVSILTIWGPDFMAPLDDAPGGAVLAGQIQAFERAHPGWQVRYVRKKPYGQGGLVHFLRATRAAAPELLPDLVLLDMSEISLLTQNQDSWFQPLGPLLGEEITSDLVPFAQEAGRVGDELVAIQYEADLRFLAYNSAIIDEPPNTWADILASQATYLLPIGATEGAVRDGFLPQYLAVGGKLVDRDGLPYLDRALVAAILEVYQSAEQAGLLPAAGFDLEDASDCWPVYLTSRAAMTNVNSWDYGRERVSRLAATRVGPLPTLSGTLISLSSGWGWALLSRKASQQAVAVEFLRSVLRPEAMAAWSRQTYHLPTRKSALALTVNDPEYLEFLQKLMEVAVPQPREPVYSLATAALSDAIESVARGRLSPQAAAAEATEKVRAAREELGTGSQY